MGFWEMGFRMLVPAKITNLVKVTGKPCQFPETQSMDFCVILLNFCGTLSTQLPQGLGQGGVADPVVVGEQEDAA